MALSGLRFYDSKEGKEYREGVSRNLWYLLLGTDGEWRGFAILWDGLPICASVFLKIQWNRDGDIDPRTGMKCYLPIFHCSHNLPMPMLSLWSQYSGPDPSPLPLQTLSPPLHSMKMRSERGGSWARTKRGLLWPPLVSEMCLQCHQFPYSFPWCLKFHCSALALQMVTSRNHPLFHPPHSAYFLSAWF